MIYVRIEKSWRLGIMIQHHCHCGSFNLIFNISDIRGIFVKQRVQCMFTSFFPFHTKMNLTS